MAEVAQLVEPRFVVPVVAGSSPVFRPIYIMPPLWGHYVYGVSEKGAKNPKGLAKENLPK